MDRRNFLRLGASGLGALWLTDLAASSAEADEKVAAVAPAPRATACIVLWMNGGPSHIDTFDPKPGSKGGGPFRAIATRAPGIMLSEHLPRLAEQADKLAFVRSMTSREGNHQRARFLAHTGYSPNPTVDHPAFGAYVGKERADAKAELPAFVSLGGPSSGAGFLGIQHGPFVVLDPGGSPSNTHYAPRVDESRFTTRRSALGFLETRFAAETADAKVQSREAVYDGAARLMRAQGLGAFDVSNEPEADKRAYGDSQFGRGCLTARRLVEAGVKYVEVQLDGWDTHKDNFGRTKNLLSVFDPAAAALLRDLATRHLLDKTLVVAMGEFGRTPVLNADEGRDHHPQAWSVMLAGGGVRGGIAYGKTDADGAAVVESAASVPDLFATMATQLGLDPSKVSDTRSGRPIGLTDAGKPIRAILT